MKKYMIVALALLILAVSAGAWAQSVASFKPFFTSGLSVDPIVFSDSPPSTYKVTLATGAYLKLNETSITQYNIHSVFGFYIVGENYQATGKSFEFDGTEWKWNGGSDPDYTDTQAAFAGWSDNDKKAEILQNDAPRPFTFDTLDVTTPVPFMGFHLKLSGLTSGQASPFEGGEVTFDKDLNSWTTTGFVIPYNDDGWNTYGTVPEFSASTLYGLGSAVVVAYPAMLGWLRKRRA